MIANITNPSFYVAVIVTASVAYLFAVGMLVSFKGDKEDE